MPPAPDRHPGPWRYIVLTRWGDISGTNSREDVDLAIQHWPEARAIDAEMGVMLGDDQQPVELLDVTRYRSLPPPRR